MKGIKLKYVEPHMVIVESKSLLGLIVTELRHPAKVWEEEDVKKLGKRIVATWNAAEEAGLSTEALEAGAVGRMVAIMRCIIKTPAQYNIPAELVSDISEVLALIGKGEG